MPTRTSRPASPPDIRTHVYLAGPDVFLPNVDEISRAKKEICRRHGLVGQFPLDNELALASLTPAEQARAISRANEAMMDRCGAIVANCTPFRGVSMDAGTAYEVGYMRALGRIVCGYTNVTESYEARVAAFRRTGRPPAEFDGDRRSSVEAFDLADNLMIACAVTETGGVLIRQACGESDVATSLAAFEACVAHLAALLGAKTPG